MVVIGEDASAAPPHSPGARRALVALTRTAL